MTQSRRGRRLLPLIVAGGLAAGAIGASGASASTPAPYEPPFGSAPNPMQTNVPYLAWRGEQVRLVKCSNDMPEADVETLRSADSSTARGIQIGGLKADVLIEDWSGPSDFKPQVESSTVDFFLSSDGICLKADVVSQKAGLAMIKMVVTLDPGMDGGLFDLFSRSEILAKHQYLAGWMNLNTPTLTELPVGGDATTLNHFNAGAADGIARVQVTGNIPLGNNFSELGLGASLTMPTDWPALAGKLASSANVDNAFPQYTWDIHDDQTAVEGHPLWGPVDSHPAPYKATETQCDDEAASADLAPRLDAVDNCDGGRAFSWVNDPDGPQGSILPTIGLTEEPTIGPFDPQRPEETFLGDGNLTADDAPMPAARVDVSIAPNSGAAGDISGVGTLHKTDKSLVFARDATKGDDAHNLYAPYYSAYIPATGDGSWLLDGSPVSGTDGPTSGNDFPGFLVGDGRGGEGDYTDSDNTYDYWDIAHVFRSAAGTDTRCLRRTDGEPAYRQTPDGPQSVAVYTDEHGQAHVNYRPGVDFYFDNLPVIRNSNGGCDLKGIDVLGTSTINAIARYPYQPTTDGPKAAPETLTKTVHSLFAKYLAVFPKGTDADSALARIVVAHAQDVDGSPFAGEKVCFMKTSASARITPFKPDQYNATNDKGEHWFGNYEVSGSYQVHDPYNAPENDRICMRLNQFGNAAIEVFESQGAEINIVADFTNERLLRDVKIPFGQPPVVIDPGTPPNTPPATGGNGNKPPSGGVLDTATNGGQVNVAASKLKARKVTVRFARFTTSARGKHALVVRLAGKAKRAKIKIRMMTRSGKTLKVARRTVRVGRSVRIKGVRIPANTAKVRISVIG